MDKVQQILEKIEKMLISKGFIKTIIVNPYRSEINYVFKNLYCIPQYVKSLGFLIEYANSYSEAQNHGHEDGDSFPLILGEESILIGLEREVQNNLE